MSKFYAIRVSTLAIVQVGDEDDGYDAVSVADDEQSDIVSDAKHSTFSFEPEGQIKSLKDLEQHGWDGMCIPYGGDGNTRLQDLLPKE